MYDELTQELENKSKPPSAPKEYFLEDYTGEYDHQSE
jgi:hypothetical protein